MASNNYSDRSAPRKAAGVFEVDQAVALAAQMSMLQQQMNQMMSMINAPAKICNLCGEHILHRTAKRVTLLHNQNKSISRTTIKGGKETPMEAHILKHIILIGETTLTYRGIIIIMCSNNNNRRDSNRNKIKMKCSLDICKRTMLG